MKRRSFLGFLFGWMFMPTPRPRLRWPIMLGTVTGRTSSSRPNLSVIPRAAPRDDVEVWNQAVRQHDELLARGPHFFSRGDRG